MNRKTRTLTTGLFLFVILLTGCRRLPLAPPTTRPTLTPTPRSTALPPVPTTMPVGSEANPLHMKIVSPSGSSQGFGVAISAVEKLLLDSTQISVSIELVETDAEALAALCASPNGTVTTAWLGGLAYEAAKAEGCGSAALQVERGQNDSSSAGDEARIVVHASLDVQTIADLAGHSFCRLGYTDPLAWMVPAMMLKEGGVAAADLKEIRDYSDAKAMVDDVAAGTCDAAAIANNEFDPTTSTRTSIRTLQQSVTIPYAVFVVPPEVPPARAQALVSALISVGNGTQADTLKLLLQQESLVVVDDSDFAALHNLISGAGIDLAQAGT